MDDKMIIQCPKCTRQVIAPSGSEGTQVTCPNCQAKWHWLLGTELIQEEISKGDIDPLKTTAALSFACSSCQHPIRIPGEEHSVVRRPIIILSMESVSHSTSRQGQSLNCRECGAEFKQISADEGRERMQQDGGEKLLDSIYPAKALGIEPIFVLFRSPPTRDTTLNLADLTLVGWPLLFLSVSVSIFVGFRMAGFVSERNGPGSQFVSFVVLIPVITGLVLFFTGKWLLEKKLNIMVIKKSDF